MRGLMMNRPLSIIEILSFAAEIHEDGEIVSVRTEGDLHRQTYAQSFARTAQLAHALTELGIRPGDRVATLAWNGYRHFELYYAISGAGAVCHTINPRLSAEQMIYILTHAEDRVLFVDVTFVPILQALKDQLPPALKIVVMTDAAHMPDSPLSLLCYEDLLEGKSTEYSWPELPEDTAAALCYTSGTTGNPKGSLYTHRSTVLHALYGAVTMRQSLYEGARALPVVPMFHVNAWGMPYMAPLVGASLIMPGGRLDGPSLYDLMQSERVTASWGVPTVWLGLRAEIEARGTPPSSLNQIVIGGSAAPRSMIEFFEAEDVDVCHAWGMTEMSPIGTTAQLPLGMQDAPLEDRLARKVLQGRRMFGVDLKIVDEDGQRLPHDGDATGELFVRGNGVVAGYFNDDAATQAAMDEEGWFGTGDVASITPDGYLNIQDRSKDLIKSGGEWISSIDLENVAMAHPDVDNCAVIAIAHPKWGERPVLVVQPKDGVKPELQVFHDMMSEHFAHWQLPDDVLYVDALPLTATGKVSKLTLRRQFAEYVLPDVG